MTVAVATAGFSPRIDKKEAILEPSLLAKFNDADLNKEGKIDKNEFMKFEAERHASKQ